MTEKELLDQLVFDYDQLWPELDKLLSEAPDWAWQKSLPDNGMTTSQLITHLYISAEPYFERIGAVLAKANESDQKGDVKFGFLGRFLLRGMSEGQLPLPKQLRVFDPVSRDEALVRWAELNARTLGLFSAARGKALNRPRFPNPLAAVFKMSAADGLAIAVKHLAYHAPQIKARLA